MQINENGQIAQDCWQNVPDHFPNVQLDAFVFMPNHMHGILVIHGGLGGGTPLKHLGAETAPLPTSSSKQTLGRMVAYYKYLVTKMINQKRNTPGMKIWQRNYYEHIIRNEHSLNRLREYIMNNPIKWELDQLHPNNPSKW